MARQRFRTPAKDSVDPKRGGLGNIRERNAQQGSVLDEVMSTIGQNNTPTVAPSAPRKKTPAVGAGYVFGSMTGDPLLQGAPKKKPRTY